MKNSDKFPILLVAVVLIGSYFLLKEFKLFEFKKTNDGNKNYHAEVIELAGKNSFSELKEYFQGLAEEKGARYAFEVLKIAPMPPNTDMHLLGHAVGDMLYRQEGLGGISACTEDFRNACSHSIVVGLFSDEGEGVLGKIVEVCRKAPGGSGAYTMCFHGLGHGILSAIGYDVPKAIELCQKTGARGESVQCSSGVVMEIIGGGGHDRDKWANQRKKYLEISKPLGLCQSDFVPKNDRYLCFVYLTPFLWESIGANMGSPTSDDFKKAFTICDTLSLNDGGNRDACFGGFGKEFVGLVQSRDIRKDTLNNIANEQLVQIYQWCKLANNKEGIAACITHAMNSLYWGGENDPKIATGFCGVMAGDNYNGGSCYMNLISSVSQYVKDVEYRENFCSSLPSIHQDHCRQVLL